MTDTVNLDDEFKQSIQDWAYGIADVLDECQRNITEYSDEEFQYLTQCLIECDQAGFAKLMAEMRFESNKQQVN
ncbi:hypothetical protein AVI51_11515 [Piscirickettsia salmonis]|uniref:Uncharacterized protein n=1 Tax=Piscirickettsia salmonis TaxID=1238 RepID=A0A095BPE9_PISSA|nr:hypothetical protein [Piscirickettsia salmonis]RNC79088.1 hypothetical protein DA717_00875 [Piscirickettsiaceae bacterium NZ-RLO2]AKP74711.1 hypothetical protein PSLF89_3221 [Piscirickettsia salmonis LF-89 = ATCC VR-1361]ALA26359.1 hypothetical protein KW89_2899 [Piscirickettsia salmonis]ALB21364.1 hypothetical protein KU39_178 [Piscirickettsia salmonis]ALY01603.1 hypothetical protein AWE47_00885 [Piscirickettsia salmonis]